MVGLGGLEPPTSRLSGVRSNQLSYKPVVETYGLSKLNNKGKLTLFYSLADCSALLPFGIRVFRLYHFNRFRFSKKIQARLRIDHRISSSLGLERVSLERR